MFASCAVLTVNKHLTNWGVGGGGGAARACVQLLRPSQRLLTSRRKERKLLQGLRHALRAGLRRMVRIVMKISNVILELDLHLNRCYYTRALCRVRGICKK